MQPTYLPWAGYFSLIKNVDKFVFLDNVQFNRDSWQSYNKILFEKKTKKIKVPTIKRPLKTLLKDIEIDPSINWQKKHFDLIVKSYQNKPHYKNISKLINKIYLKSSYKYLVELNIDIIKEISKILKINTKFYRSSLMDIKGIRSERIANICDHLNCDSYISPLGAYDYLTEDKFKKKYNIKLKFIKFNNINYDQFKSNEFISNLSIIDALSFLELQFVIDYLNNYSLVNQIIKS